MDVLSSLLSSLRSVDPGTVDQEYQMLRSQSLLLKKQHSLTSDVGSLKENIKKNRYKDILPYDQSRVVLSLQTSGAASDYINASFIQGAAGDCRYIASQGPLSSTLTDFWRMIWQHQVKVIVMACRETEMGKRKCECYWAAPLQSAAFGPFIVTTQVETRPNEDFVVRTMTVHYQQDVRSVVQFQYLSWPDHDVPYDTAGVQDLLERARSSRGDDTSPVLIHCSAGCGRTGVICALDYIHDLVVTKRITKDFSFLNVVLELRRQRPSAVQTKDQYQFIFMAAASMFERFLQTPEDRLYCNLPEVKTREQTLSAGSPTSSMPQKLVMNDTYAVVNKAQQPHRTASEPTYSCVAPARSSPGSRTPSHHYDNDFSAASAAPIYSTVKPKVKALTPAHSHIYDIADPANQSSQGSDYHLVPAEAQPHADDDYEDVSSPVLDVTSFFTPGGIGFNCRIQKPKGPREPPAAWGRL